MKRKYSKQFKENALKLSEEKGNMAAAARELGICSSVIRRWKQEKREYANNSFPGHGVPKLTDDQREIQRLKKALKESELEAEILKKAISIFSKNDKRNINL